MGLYDWVDERLGVKSLVRGFLDRPIPANVGWLNTLGSATLFLLLVQIATGISLVLFYVPAADNAYQSVQHIDTLAFGALVRGVHHWSASALVVLIGLHTLRVFFHAAFRYPRELTWVVGALLFLVTLGFAFTGYLLPWDQKAYWATVVGTNVAGSAPFVGDLILNLLRGGPAMTTATLTRFYGIHVWVLPAALLLLVGLHLFMVIRQGIAAPPRRKPISEEIPGETKKARYTREYAAEKSAGHPFYQSLLKDAVVAVGVILVVAALALAVGAPLEARADPSAVGYVPRPEWYFLDVFQMLWYVSGPAEPLIIFLAGTVGFLVFLLLPFLDRGRERHPRRRPVATLAGVLVVVAVAVLTYQGATAPAPVAAGADLTASGSLTASQKAGLHVFGLEGCAACHMVNGSGGTAGPDLTHVAARLGSAEIQHQILQPRDKMPPYTDIAPPDMTSLLDFLSTLK
ncbi:MAG: cytochrome b N-terminal domain-containing protein [Candidatus Limnocylindrales bacterium]